MVLSETLLPLSKWCTCFFGLPAFSVKAWQCMCLKNIAKSKLGSQYQANKTHCTKGKQQFASQASPPPSEKPKGKVSNIGGDSYGTTGNMLRGDESEYVE